MIGVYCARCFSRLGQQAWESASPASLSYGLEPVPLLLCSSRHSMVRVVFRSGPLDLTPAKWQKRHTTVRPSCILARVYTEARAMTPFKGVPILSNTIDLC